VLSAAECAMGKQFAKRPVQLSRPGPAGDLDRGLVTLHFTNWLKFLNDIPLLQEVVGCSRVDGMMTRTAGHSKLQQLLL